MMLVYLTIGMPLLVAVPLAISVGACCSREYFINLRQYQQRQQLPRYALNGCECMGGVPLRASAAPVTVGQHIWQARWRR